MIFENFKMGIKFESVWIVAESLDSIKGNVSAMLQFIHAELYQINFHLFVLKDSWGNTRLSLRKQYRRMLFVSSVLPSYNIQFTKH